ncbi:helix-turn-helix domain-containing protein [Serratia marcescens]|uniref:helix-turn-helix domain-containing protein n=1 Tax=Serratia marcescens TaxID=615 RepID=UPI000CCF7A70|nr:helix-turn-helix domain-containing protein [Serratia marcescens]PNU35803.1 RNA polymerase subunit sigma-24 [Serratia marcescens]
MFEEMDLPDQFGSDNTPPDLNKMDSMNWRMFQSGWVPSANDLQAPAIKQLYERYRTTHSSSDMKAAVADKLRAEVTIRKLAMQNPNRVGLKQSQVTSAVKESLDAYHTGTPRPSIDIVRSLLPGKDVKPVMSRPQQRRRLKKGLRANSDHPAVVTAQKQGNPIRMDADTISSGLQSLQNAAMVVRKLNDHEQRMQDMEARLKELEAFKDSTEKRHAIEDAGQTPEQRVVELRKQGLGYKAIQSATGISQSTVRNWVKAHGL